MLGGLEVLILGGGGGADGKPCKAERDHQWPAFVCFSGHHGNWLFRGLQF